MRTKLGERTVASVFTKIINRELSARIVWEDDAFIALLPNAHFVNQGHLLLVPKIEVDGIFDLPAKTYQKLWLHAKALSATLQKITEAPRIGIAVEGFSVPHVHVHLCPVYEVAQLDPHRSVSWTETDRDAFVRRFKCLHATKKRG